MPLIALVLLVQTRTYVEATLYLGVPRVWHVLCFLFWIYNIQYVRSGKIVPLLATHELQLNGRMRFVMYTAL